MKRIDMVANNKRWPSDVIQVCKQDSLHFVPFRVFIILYNVGKLKSSSVPFVHRRWFLAPILFYICWKRMVGIVTRSDPTISGHVFCCSSGSAYRTETLFELLDYFRRREEETTLFTVSEAEEQFRSEYNADSTSIISFSECFSTVSPLGVIESLPRLWGVSEEMAQLLEVESIRYRIVAFNFLVVEYIKYRSVKNTAGVIESFHTFAPMPYQTKAICNKKIYAYQHGVENDNGRAMSIPRYAPVTYLIWGDFWVNKFNNEEKIHPDSKIYPVGSPRHDNLINKRWSRGQNIDLLFISGSHTLSREGANKDAYRNLVDMVVNMCEQRGWELVIKLHPIEEPEKYKKWGYSEYITDETSIETLLLKSEIAVTDLSSAYLESICLGTPIVVTQSSTAMDIEPSNQLGGLAFPDSIDESKDKISELKGSDMSIRDIKDSNLLNLTGSCQRIHEMVAKGCR